MMLKQLFNAFLANLPDFNLVFFVEEYVALERQNGLVQSLLFQRSGGKSLQKVVPLSPDVKRLVVRLELNLQKRAGHPQAEDFRRVPRQIQLIFVGENVDNFSTSGAGSVLNLHFDAHCRHQIHTKVEL